MAHRRDRRPIRFRQTTIADGVRIESLPIDAVARRNVPVVDCFGDRPIA